MGIPPFDCEYLWEISRFPDNQNDQQPLFPLLPPAQLLFLSLSLTATGSLTPPVDNWGFMEILCQLVESVFSFLLVLLSLFLLGIKGDSETTSHHAFLFEKFNSFIESKQKIIWS